ncbi:hypothetical protein G6F65_022584 [Rhizopus arrhizus]|nr:hypothetical protein G6F65_022584 [Rhizopus arrhizus]
MSVTDRATGAVTEREVTVDKDTCNRPGTTFEALAGLAPVRGEGQFVTAGNAAPAFAPWAPSAAWPLPAASPTKWASAPSMRFPSCWRATA